MSRLVRVVVWRCGGTDLLLEARQGDAVDAHVAVHADVSFLSLCVTFDQKVSNPPIRPEVPGVAHLDAWVQRGERLALLADSLLEDACKQKIGENDDALRAEPAAALKAVSYVRRGHANVRTLDDRVRAALVEEAGYLGEVRVGVRVR